MKQDYTHLIIVLDGSGSMAGLQKATIEGVNSLVSNQEAQPGTLSTALYRFDSTVAEVVGFTTLTPQNYMPLGATALLDAVGLAVVNEGEKLANMSEDDRPSRVVVMIVTDGEENASKRYTLEQIKDLVELQKNTYSWEFVFLGANIDAFSAGSIYGFAAKSTLQWNPDANGIHVMYASVNEGLTNYRSGTTNCVDLSKTVS